jgi:predicted nucleic acid-binding protein
MLVIDASVAVKWFVAQPGSDDALAILKRGDDLIAPDLVVVESANVFWRSVKAGFISGEDGTMALAHLGKQFTEMFSTGELVSAAYDLSLQLNHAVYDCVYLALAQRQAAALVTCDKRLAQAARKLPDVEVRYVAAV